MAEQNHHAEKAPPHTETPTPPSSSPQPDHEKLNELSSSEPVHEQRESKKPEMAMAEEDSDEGFEYTADPGISPIEFELELAALVAEFWFDDSDNEVQEPPKPLVSSITKGISRMVGWRDWRKEKSRQESDPGARERRAEGSEADMHKKD